MFEREIRSVSAPSTTAAARAGALHGRPSLLLVLGSSLLTLAYDSDKAEDLRLFRDP